MIDRDFSILLGAALLWTIIFSVSSSPGFRGYRNLGWMGSYVLLLVMLIRLPISSALATWGLFGICGGLLYVGYEVVARGTAPRNAPRPQVSYSHLLFGLIAWPIMAPEAIEYALAELGFLADRSQSSAP